MNSSYGAEYSSSMSTRGTLGEQREVRLAVAPQDLGIHLDPADAARLGEDPRLRLHDLRREDPSTRAHPGLAVQPLQVTGQLLDRVDRPHPLDLDRDPFLVGIAAHQVDRADVGGPLATHEPHALAAPLG